MVATRAKVRAIKPKNACRRVCFTIAMSSCFEYIVTSIILMNIVVLAMEHYPADENYVQILDYINMGFTFFFVLEAFINILGLGPNYYFHKSWNRLDFFIAMMGLLTFK